MATNITERQFSKPETNPIVEAAEFDYPEMTAEFKRLQDEQYVMFCQKTMNYGVDAIKYGGELDTNQGKGTALTGAWFRMYEKVQRIKQMVLHSKADLVGESLEDTYKDLSVFGIICRIIINDKWGK